MLGATACAPANRTADGVIALRGATIHPAPNSPPIPQGVVLIRDGKIEAVGSAASIEVPEGAAELDLTGQYLVAGYWNSHVHFAGERWAGADSAQAARLNAAVREMLTRWGVTSAFDTGSDLAGTLALRQRIDSGDVDGPRIFTTGDIIFPSGAPMGRFRVTSPGEAGAAADSLLARNADGIKVYAQAWWDPALVLSPEVLARVVAAAHQRNLPVFAHPSNRVGLHNAVAAGVDVLTHTTPQIGPWSDSLIASMRAADMALIPTLALWRFELEKESVPAAEIAEFQGRGVAQLRAWFAAGGTVLFGTDVGYMTDFSTVEELEQMAAAGMSFHDILASMTTVPAAWNGLEASSGRIAAGFDADLVVLGSDPTRDITALADVRYTFRGGRPIYSAAEQ